MTRRKQRRQKPLLPHKSGNVRSKRRRKPPGAKQKKQRTLQQEGTAGQKRQQTLEMDNDASKNADEFLAALKIFEIPEGRLKQR